MARQSLFQKPDFCLPTVKSDLVNHKQCPVTVEMGVDTMCSTVSCFSAEPLEAFHAHVQLQHVLGEVEDERYMKIALYQGIPATKRKGQMAFAMGQEMNTVQNSEPTLITCALNRQRFYLFSRREPADTDDAALVCGHLFAKVPICCTDRKAVFCCDVHAISCGCIHGHAM